MHQGTHYCAWIVPDAQLSMRPGRNTAAAAAASAALAAAASGPHVCPRGPAGCSDRAAVLCYTYQPLFAID